MEAMFRQTAERVVRGLDSATRTRMMRDLGQYRLKFTHNDPEQVRVELESPTGHDYVVRFKGGQATCGCPHNIFRKTICKHIAAVSLMVVSDVGDPVRHRRLRVGQLQ